jgi:hypothetical protein
MSRGPLSEAKSPHAQIPPKNQNNSYNTQEVHNKTVQRHGTFFLKEWEKKTPFPAVCCLAPSLQHAKLAKLATGGYRHDGPPGCQRVHPAFPASVPMEVQKCLDLLGILVETA